jgi:carbonic anhydrase
MRFCTVINCMDGRVQLPVNRYLQKRFNVKYVDSITEAGPNLILSEEKSITSIQSILERLKISIENHNSAGIAIVGHHDCAGNPAPQNDQIIHPAFSGYFICTGEGTSNA